MPNLSIKDVPDAWAEALRQRAARNHRSLQGELMALIGQAVSGISDTQPQSETMRPPGSPRVVGYNGYGPIVRTGWKTIEQIAAEHLASQPKPISKGPLAVDLIREDRDAR